MKPPKKAIHLPTGRACEVVHYGLERCYCKFENGQHSHIPTTDLNIPDKEKPDADAERTD